MSFAKFFDSNKTHVIELYSYSDESIEEMMHEIISGTDAGSILTDIYGQELRFVYVPQAPKFRQLLAEAKARGYTQSIVNLYEPNNISYLAFRLQHGDSILINAQSDIQNNLIAGYEAEELANILNEDLGLNKFLLKNLDVDSCMMGRIKSYRDELKRYLTTFQTITTYTDLCSVSKKNNNPSRIWIAEKKDWDIFYSENELNEKGTRIIEYTDAYMNQLKASSLNFEESELKKHDTLTA
ncbi:hypothetical protein ACD661_10585 [Legionella lytica]|uniref:Uncharacterized protein n=1 Tax=Legionella lytica TaxID=96232 RepID=A0ABW8D8H8_9GAMM